VSGPVLRLGTRKSPMALAQSGRVSRTRAGCPWRDLPEGYGNWKTVCDRHRRWSLDGTWERVLDSLRAGCDEAGGADWTVSADSAVVRGHQHAAGARRPVPAGLVTGHRRMTRTRRAAGRAGRLWAAAAAG
jgi:transposase